MGIFDFIKKFIREDDLVERESITFNDINQWVINKREETESKSKEFLELIGSRINRFNIDVEEKILVLEGLNIDNIKSDEKIKLVVRENLAKYIEHIKKFKEGLNALEKDSAVKLVNNFEELFSRFKKRSSMNYQKSIILIGKELGDVSGSIALFVKDIDKTVKSHKNFFEQAKTLEDIQNKLEERKKMEGSELNIYKVISRIGSEIKESKNEIAEISKDIEKIKGSERHIKIEKEKEQIEETKHRIKSKISDLKSEINFKELANFFHIIEEDMEVVKFHKENFREAFEKDCGLELMRLLEESKLESDKIKSNVEEIIKMKKEVNDFAYENGELEDLGRRLREEQIRVEKLISLQESEKKKKARFEENVREIESLIKKDLEQIGVDVK